MFTTEQFLIGGTVVAVVLSVLVGICVWRCRKKHRGPQLPNLTLESNDGKKIDLKTVTGQKKKKKLYEKLPLQSLMGAMSNSPPSPQGGETDDNMLTFRSNWSKEDKDLDMLLDGELSGMEFDRATLEQLELLDAHDLSKSESAKPINPFDLSFTVTSGLTGGAAVGVGGGGKEVGATSTPTLRPHRRPSLTDDTIFEVEDDFDPDIMPPMSGAMGAAAPTLGKKTVKES